MVHLTSGVAAQTNLLALNATLEIARSMQQAAVGTAEVSASIGHVLEATQKTREAVGYLVGLADALSGKSVGLRKEVGGFISAIRSAQSVTNNRV